MCLCGAIVYSYKCLPQDSEFWGSGSAAHRAQCTGVAILVIWEVAYLLHDTWSMVLQRWRHKRPLDSVVMAHHVSLATLLPIYFLYQKGDFYLATLYLQNASTPLLHGRYMLLKSELKGTLLHKSCAGCLLVVFFVVRILLWPALFAVHSYTANVPMRDLYQHVRSYCLITAAAMCTVNMLWWSTLVRKIVRLDMRLKHEPVQKHVGGVEAEMNDVVKNKTE